MNADNPFNAISSRITPPSTPRAATGISGLDEILGGGFPCHHLYLVQGDPGVGKTTLSLQFLLEGARQGETGLFITLSEGRDELNTVAASHGWSLEGIHVFELSAVEDSLDEKHHYTVFHPSEVELGAATRLLLDEVERVKPARVVLDSLSELRLLAQDPLRYRRQILAFKQYFSGKNCTVLMLDDNSETGDLQVQSLAHGVLLLKHDTPDYGTERRRLRVVKLRGARFRGGEHAFNIETGGLEVFPRLIAAEHHRPYQREVIKSGLPELDVLLGGGLEFGTSALIMGPAGVGKSTLTNLYARTITERDECATIFIFDETQETMFTRAAGLGIDLRGLVEKGNLTIHPVDPAQLAPDEFSHLVRAEVEENNARLIIIDSLNGYLNSMPGERFLIVQLHELLTYLAQQGVLTLLVMSQHGLMGSSMNSPLDLSYISDSVMLMRYFEHGGRVHQAISVLKKRSGSHEHTIHEFRMSPAGVEVGKPLEEYQGVMTGVPVYRGKSAMIENTHDQEASNSYINSAGHGEGTQP
ncbi:MAG TPA: ATPase domain-containing protein [Abditibacteriaceae bacterium]|jgi:circadian clock protein KaiC